VKDGVEFQITMLCGYYIIVFMGIHLNLYFIREGESYVDFLNLLFIKPSHKKLLSYN
jgi:hypothetical protein